MSEVPRAPGSPRELFVVFTRMALMGFGGVLPIAQHVLVERERWLTNEQFIELLSLGQVLPGPNVVNLALMVGDRYFGWRGALAALAGMLLAPLAIVIALAALYVQFVSVPAVAGALRGMGAVAAGLVLAVALKMIPALAGNPLGRWPSLLIALAAALAVGGLRWPAAGVMLALGGTSVALAWSRLR
jgi:chromate transporter